MKLKLDMHVHTNHSKDGLSDVKFILLQAKRRGLDGLAITDHNTCKALKQAEKLAEKFSLLLIKGQEVRCKEGDLLVYGLDFSIPKGMNARDVIKIVQKHGGVAVVAHPFGYLFHLKSCSGDKMLELEVDGVEVFNSRSAIGNWKALEYARKLKLPIIAGSDAHHWREVGKAYTTVECKEKSEEAVLDAIRKGKTWIGGRKSSLLMLSYWYFARFLKLASLSF